ncbi:MAG: C45 family autoproteolytic acyltransferase/hydrolase [Solirubrobacteraceae bacterium]
MLELTMSTLVEDQPGEAWRALFEELWPAYRRWYLREGMRARAPLARAQAALSEYMPELVGTWEKLVSLAGEDQLAAAMLTLYDPPRYVTGCAQAVFAPPGGPPILVRNYDYTPHLFERVVHRSALGERTVLGTSDCLWGLLDGINESGLAVSLAFGGRRASGPGFAISLIIRYLLETCATVADSERALRRLPVQCSYNLTLLDGDGDAATIWIGPDRLPERAPAPVATNHQAAVEWVQYANWTRTVERLTRLQELREQEAERDQDRIVGAFLRPPLRTVRYNEGMGTLYTLAMSPSDGSLEYRWPGSSWRMSLSEPARTAHTVVLEDSDRLRPLL